MSDDQTLRKRLRKIEAVFAGAGAAAEKLAAGAAAERICARLAKSQAAEAPVETRFSVPDIWSHQLFVALCRRYGLKPFRYRRMHQPTIIVKAPRSFIDQVLWPEFQLSKALTTYLAEVTERVIREEVHCETAEAEEWDEPKCLAR